MRYGKAFKATALISTAAMMLSMAACGSADDAAQDENPTTIKIWHYEEDNSAMSKAWDKAMELFEKETGVKVEFEKKSFQQIRQNSSQILNSDEAPDVMEYNKGNATAGLLASQGLLSNLDDYVSEYKWDSKIPGSLAETAKYNEQGIMGSGSWYGVTNSSEGVIAFYNKDMFDKYGLDIPETMDDLEKAMQTFVDNGITPLAESAQDTLAQHLWWQLVLQKADSTFLKNYETYAGKVDWNNEALTYATKTISDWTNKGYISKDATGMKAEDAGTGFINGTYPIYVTGTWWYGRLKSDMTDANWVAQKFPESKKIPGSSGNIWVIPENSKKKDLAAKFINITLSDEVQNLLGQEGGLPIAADPSAITDEKDKALIETFNDVIGNDGFGFYPDWPTSTLYDELNASLQELINGSTDVNGFLDQMKTNYDNGVEAAGITVG